jgi:hypothetical protein
MLKYSTSTSVTLTHDDLDFKFSATQLIRTIYGIMTDQDAEIDLIKNRSYWQDYIKAAESRAQAPGSLSTPVTRRHSPSFPPLSGNFALANKMAVFLKFIDTIVDENGFSRFTAEDILAKFPMTLVDN